VKRGGVNILLMRILGHCRRMRACGLSAAFVVMCVAMIEGMIVIAPMRFVSMRLRVLIVREGMRQRHPIREEVRDEGKSDEHSASNRLVLAEADHGAQIALVSRQVNHKWQEKRCAGRKGPSAQ